ncbi:hypothetical protein [Halovivax sp.]|uniref:hypothetical protein n=1 Tax=Halovivax sp. TaxID=1935978 RepID=UPI0025C54308|nr:hypothetical protein [Halovivax sp.]
MGPADSSYDPAEASHRALRGIQRELERHPAIDSVRGFPSGEYTRVVARVATDRLDVAGDDATLTVRWFAGESPDAPPEFSFHYSDETGDFGWHHEPNPHVDGWGHFQDRAVDENDYAYEPHGFSSNNPTRVVWEVTSLLMERL